MRSPKRGQIFRLKSDLVGKPRPVVVVSPTHLNGGNSLLAVPFFGGQIERRKLLRTCVFFKAGESGLEKDCVAKADNVSLFRLSELRMVEGPVGEVTLARMDAISAALAYSLGILLPQQPESNEPLA